MKHATNCLLALLMFLIGSAAADAGVLYARRPGTETPVYNLRISNIRTTVNITGQLAVTHVDEEFYNENTITLEGFYAFQLPEGANVDGLWLWVDGNRLIFIVKKKEDAQRMYDSVVVGQRRDPAILESLGNNRFQLKVFPINPRSSRRIEIRYFHTLPMTPDGLVHYRYPLNLQGYQTAPVERTQLRVNVSSLQRIEEFRTNFDHNPLLCRTVRQSDFSTQVDFGLEQQIYTEDFEVSFRPENAFEGFPSLTYIEDDGSEYPYFVCWHPVRLDEAVPQPRDLVFVLDASGSMYDQRRKTVAAAVAGILPQLRDIDRFRIVLFSDFTVTYPAEPTLMTASPENIIEGIDFIERMYLTGGSTNYQRAFLAALDADFRDDAVRRMLFLTDGIPNIGVTTTNGLLQTIREHDSLGVGIYPVIIYSDRIDQLYDIAEDRGGKVTMVENGDNLTTVISRIMLELNIGGISNPSVFYDAGNAYFVYPHDFSSVMGIDKLVTTGRLTSLAPGDVRLNYRDATGRQVDLSRTVHFDATRVDVPQVASYWAASHINALLKRYETEKNEELKESIIALSIKHQILTPFTAFLVLETNEIDPPITIGEATPPAAARIIVGQNYPNPFSPSSGTITSIPYTLPASTPVRIVITDVLGRVLRVLVDAQRGAGGNVATWDGRDDTGRLVAPGMYFVRLHAAGVTQVLRITVVR
ncbi:MAG: VIT domain-containing protein [Bacteroidota bacterium]|jgi:Ca-activated chloride channel family protein|nr:VIT domain-containing protein [Bacteroidota bacterium]